MAIFFFFTIFQESPILTSILKTIYNCKTTARLKGSGEKEADSSLNNSAIKGVAGRSVRRFQVWFQNKRSKERRLKQLTSMGRNPFFGGSRKMRGFPLNLNPGALGGEDGPPPGFPYFGPDKFEFGYGGPVAFHHEFFGAHPPPHPHGPHFAGTGNPGESPAITDDYRCHYYRRPFAPR